VTTTVALLAACLAFQTAPRRVRLFDHMAHAKWTRPDPAAPAESDVAAAASTRSLGFEASTPCKLWLGRPAGRDVKWASDPAEVARLASLVAEGGVHGGALRLGPDLVEDLSFASLLVEVKPLTRYVLRGRVKLVGHPAADESSAREVVRVLEHTARLLDPTTVDRYGGAILGFHRASREGRDVDSSGWDRFELEIPLTAPDAGHLQIRLLHRSGGVAQAQTWFDDLELEETPLSEAATWRMLEERSRPNDGHASEEPWRRRVTLPTHDLVKEETRDALLLRAPASVAIPLVVPAKDAAPILRFAYGLLPEAFVLPGGAERIDVAFAPDGGGESVALGRFDFDPKHVEADRGWLHARVDLASVAGRSGTLVFSATTAKESASKESESAAVSAATPRFDAVVVATPRVEPAHEAPKGWNVLLMASDTLRADRLSAYGYGRPTSPNLERLAKSGIRFAQTRSQAPWTLPSFSSIMSSLPPSEHGAGRGGRDEWTPLEPGVTTLAGVLARVGYETVGITANHLISPDYGLDQGFESYAVPAALEWQKIGLESVSLDAPLVVDFLEGHTNSPFLLFWHMMDPHLPYTTPPEIRALFTDPKYDGRFAGPDPIVPFQVLDPRPGRRWFTQEGPPKPPPLTDADKQFVSDYYDAEIGEIDRAIGTVLDTLERTGMADRTIVVMTADHGEGLGEHGHYHHGYTLFEDQIHIPWIVRVPGGGAGVVRDEPVASIDVAPTLLGLLGLAAPESFRGVNRLAAQPPDPAANPVFVEYPSYDSSAQKAVMLGSFKYLHDPWFHTEALYDVANDPLERTDVRAAHPDLVSKGRALLDEFRWTRMQRGRFHVLVHAPRGGGKLRLEVDTDDLLDANFATRPLVDERDFTLDFDRRHLVLETTLAGDRLELVCWGRGDHLTFGATIDGQPLAIRFGGEAATHASPFAIVRSAVPTVAGATLAPPKPMEAAVWMEPGAGDVKPVVPSPADAEMLRRLGYAH
jgi:arylsulfatase A-like enzyme